MKTVILVRHSEPQRGTDLPNEKIPLSGRGRELAEKFFYGHRVFEGCRCVYSSTYARAVETAGHLPHQIVFDDRLVERALGNPDTLDEHFWAKQYEDLDFKNQNGESLNEAARRMDSCVLDILNRIADGEKAVVVSHAAAICAYLTKFCTITVISAEEKTRRIQFRNAVVLQGKIDTPSAFVLQFNQDVLTEISYVS